MFTQFFPYKNIREEQEKIINTIEQNFDDYDNFILEAPTGTGKSAIAYTLSKNVKQALILTSTKYLQNQYELEFKDILSVKGRSAYKCAIDKCNCDEAVCRINTNIYKRCNRKCEYMQNLDLIPTAKITVTNYAAFLSNPSFKKRHYDLIILDECHLIESNILSILSSNINIEKLNNKFDLFCNADLTQLMEIFNFQPGYEANAKGLYELDKLMNLRLAQYDMEIRNADDLTKLSLQELKDDLDKINKKLKYFLNSDDRKDWVCEPNDETLYIQPLNIGNAFNNIFAKHANKLVCMSATILQAKSYIEDLGLDITKTKCMRVSSNFNPKLSPIIHIPCGKMNYANINNSLPKIIQTINELLEKHKGQKGIIHTNNYKITEEIIKRCNNPRLLHSNSKSKFYKINNEELLQLHIKNPNDTVLVSPSLNTGADLKDDLSRFQIIVKLPFASLQDKRVAKKMKLKPQWYTNEMLRTLIQMTGRSIRHDKDYCVTYILDSSFMYYIKQNNKLFTEQFKQRIFSGLQSWNEEEYQKLIKSL